MFCEELRPSIAAPATPPVVSFSIALPLVETEVARRHMVLVMQRKPKAG
jgi:hypothetical protein